MSTELTPRTYSLGLILKKFQPLAPSAVIDDRISIVKMSLSVFTFPSNSRQTFIYYAICYFFPPLRTAQNLTPRRKLIN